MAFRKALLFLFALLAVLYALVFFNGNDACIPLSAYWVPRATQLPGFRSVETESPLKLEDDVLLQLEHVDALAETLDQTPPQSGLFNLLLQLPKKKATRPKKEKKKLDASSPKSLPIQRIEFDSSGYEQLANFYEQLDSLEVTGGTVRILHYGDSQIEGDRISSYLRSRLQKEFGGGGVGFISPLPPTYPPFGLTLNASRGWHYYSIMPAHKRKKALAYGVLGSVSQFITNGELEDTTQISASVVVKRDLSAGRGMQFTRCNVLFSSPLAPCRMGIYVNDSISYYRQFSVSSLLQRAEFPVPSGTKKFTLQFSAEETPNIYGISFETVDGVQVDNVPLRGSSGTDFGAISDSMWMAINQVLAPRLVLLQFGVNVVPSQLTSYVHYGRQLQAQIERLKRLLPNTAFILIGVSDMGHKEEEVFHSYPNINLVRTAQRKAALASGIAFWDSYTAMGGANSIIRWVNAQPPLATSDYVHFTPRGARFLAELFYTALMDVYQLPESYKPSHSTQD